jgi:hypothetical protein
MNNERFEFANLENLENLKKEYDSFSIGQKGMGREPITFEDWVNTHKQPKTY